MKNLTDKKSLSDKKVKTYKRRPSFDIARSFVEMNFAVLMAPEMTDKEARKAAKAEQKAARQEAKKRHRVRNSILAGLGLIILCLGVSLAWWKTSLEPVNSDDKSTQTFVIGKGDSMDIVADGLQKTGFIRNALAFRIYIRINSITIQAGSHTLSPSYSMSEVATKLSKADASERDVKINDRSTLKDLKSDWQKKYGFSEDQIDEAFNANYTNSVLDNRPKGSSLEGYIFPDTYRIYSTDSPKTLINKSLTKLDSIVKSKDLKSKFAANGLTLYQGITLASIIGKEVDTNLDDQKTVAGVFYNRLNSGIALGSDVTFHYAYSRGLCDANTPACVSDYNTRIHSGLPPGPIANVTESALVAAAEPIKSDNFYFVAGDGADQGKTFFSRTYEEHKANIAAHCHTSCN